MATFQAVKTYADRIKKHDCIALAELVHCGKEKFRSTISRKRSGSVDCVNSAGVPVRAMTKDDMDRIANDFAVAAVYMQKAGFDGILVHGGHGFIFTQYLSPLMNTRPMSTVDLWKTVQNSQFRSAKQSVKRLARISCSNFVSTEPITSQAESHRKKPENSSGW